MTEALLGSLELSETSGKDFLGKERKFPVNKATKTGNDYLVPCIILFVYFFLGPVRSPLLYALIRPCCILFWNALKNRLP